MATVYRTVEQRFDGAETLEGAGVRLRRMFGNSEVPLLDPFLLLDNFGSTNPADYLAGFPWHPHRGIETVTYMMQGTTAHEDSLGNKGVIGAGDVQWMSAGSGILHQEMPERTEGRLSGFQLWVNLPKDRKMETPAYRGVTAPRIPIVRGEDGRSVKVIAGTYGGAEGPVRHIPVEPLYLDVTLPPGGRFEQPVHRGHTAFAQVVEGTGRFDERREGIATTTGPAPPPAAAGGAAKPRPTFLYGDGDAVGIEAGEAGLRFLFVTGRPLHEPVAWYGPIVMNTRDELQQAFSELRRGNFIRTSKVVVEE